MSTGPAPGVFDFTRQRDSSGNVVDYSIYSGADWAVSFGFHELPGGRMVDDLILVEGSTSATSATADFTSDDTDKKIATEDGTGIDDGTTMEYVSETEITLSSPATASGTFVATVQSLNCSAYSDHAAQVRKKPGGQLMLNFAVEDARSAVGWHVLSIASTDSEPITGNGVWDWRMVGPEGVSFPMSGTAHVRANVTVTT